MGQNKRPEEREFYLNLALKAKWSKRELARQIQTAAFERTVLSDKKLAALPRLLTQDATGVFKDSYLLDFLDLPANAIAIIERGRQHWIWAQK
jgi:predicted nuclease of restriction endonuclease-like (RecB) superfamily